MTAENLQDLADVRSLIQLYIDGSNGDGDKMRQAFHPDAHMFGHIGPMDTYEPITDFTALVEKQPGLAGPNYRADVRTIDLVGDAGVAVLVETDYFGCDFVDFFTVAAHRWSLVDHEQDVRPHRRHATSRLEPQPNREPLTRRERH